MKGIILAGGSGTRLYPLTLVTSKQLLPVYDKPMIYYSLSTLMLANIKDILIISTPEDTPKMEQLLGDGRKFGINLKYAVQEKPNGIVQAFIIGEQFINNDACCLILGDNIFYGAFFIEQLKKGTNYAESGFSSLYVYYVKDPQRYGIVELDDNDIPLKIEEKPSNPKSNYCVTGLYFYPKGVCELAKTIKPSKRGEYEITELNNLYIQQKKTRVLTLGRGYSWLDTGTQESLVDASNFIKTIEEHQGIKISCPEEIAYKNGRISKDTLIEAGELMKKNEYGQHLLNVASGRIKY